MNNKLPITSITRACHELQHTYGSVAFIPKEDDRVIVIRLPHVRAIHAVRPYTGTEELKKQLRVYIRKEQAIEAGEWLKENKRRTNELF